MQDEKLMTAATQNFVVSVRSRPGLSHPLQTIIIVKARSIDQAKNEAAKKLKTGKYSMRKIIDWIFDSVEIA